VTVGRFSKKRANAGDVSGPSEVWERNGNRREGEAVDVVDAEAVPQPPRQVGGGRGWS